MMGHKDTLEKCDENCKREMFCDINYAVNEESLLCRGYYVDFNYGCHYMVGIF